MTLEIKKEPRGERLTQADQILNHLLKGNRLTSLAALRRFGCARLASRIYDLTLKGYEIKKIMIKNALNPDGVGKQYARYYIENPRRYLGGHNAQSTIQV